MFIILSKKLVTEIFKINTFNFFYKYISLICFEHQHHICINLKFKNLENIIKKLSKDLPVIKLLKC